MSMVASPPVVHALSFRTERSETGKRLKVAECVCGWVCSPAKSTATVMRVAGREHPQAFCPTTGKRRFAARRDAELALLDFWQTAASGKKELLRVYECDCGGWHTTSWPARGGVS